MLRGNGTLEYEIDNFLSKTSIMYDMWTCRMCEELCYDFKYHLMILFKHAIKT